MSDPGGSSSSGGTVVLARKKANGGTNYATITDDHMSHILSSITDKGLHEKLSALQSDSDS